MILYLVRKHDRYFKWNEGSSDMKHVSNYFTMSMYCTLSMYCPV